MTNKPNDPDAIAELTKRAEAIAGSANDRVVAAMRDVIDSHAGMSGFSVESVRDVVHFLVRRGEMSVVDGERLIREAEAAQAEQAGRSVAAEKVRPMPKRRGSRER